MMMILWTFLFLLLITPGVAATDTYPSNPPRLIDDVVPFQRWTPHDSHVTGLIFTSPQEMSDSLGISWTRTLSDHDPYWFSVYGDSPQVLYWPSGGEGENFLSNWQVPTRTGGIRRYDAAMFTPTTPNPYGLQEEMHVVTLEVNDQFGSTDGVHFVATATAVVWTPIKALLRMRRKFNKCVKETGEKALNELKALENQVVEKNPGGTVGSPILQVGEFPTYYPKNACLQVTFYRHWSNTITFPAEVDPTYYDCPLGAPCLPPPLTQRVIQLGVEEYIQFEKCRGGVNSSNNRQAIRITGTDRKKYVQESRQVTNDF